MNSKGVRGRDSQWVKECGGGLLKYFEKGVTEKRDMKEQTGSEVKQLQKRLSFHNARMLFHS